MREELEKKLGEFKEYIKKLEYLGSAAGVLYWDMRVMMPKKAVSYRAEVLGYIYSEQYKLQTSDEIKEYIDYFSEVEELDEVTKAMVEKVKKTYNQSKKIPEKLYKDYVILTSNAETVWEEAKEKSDFDLFKPYLEKIVEYNKQFVEYWGYKDNKYDTLLDFYEKDITTTKLDEIFGKLKENILTLLVRIKESKVEINTDFFKKNFNVEEQESFGRFVLEKMGFDFLSGRLDVSVHPFTINFNNKDVRITTHFYENDLRSALFGCIHEGGHAIYEQNIPDSLKGTLLSNGTSMGIHESQSRFYENIIGRSLPFWKYFYPEAQRRFTQLKDVSLMEFYKGINCVNPSLIRIEADELTYSIHIIIRYELEKALINGEITVEELPELWNEKYKDYLGVEPENNSQGVLQDVHWAGGSFGYFPSYALGNLYGAQFLNTMEKEIPNLYKEIENGQLASINSWLKEHIHKYGESKTPSQLIFETTGEELKSDYFIDYLNKKYTQVYELN